MIISGTSAEDVPGHEVLVEHVSLFDQPSLFKLSCDELLITLFIFKCGPIKYAYACIVYDDDANGKYFQLHLSLASNF